MRSFKDGPLFQIFVIAVVLGVCAAAPMFDITTVDLLIVFAAYAALGISWNWVGGFAGLLNMAHIAYYAIGAYACAIAVTGMGIHPVFGIVVGALVAGLLAFVISLVSFKLKVSELYYALLTLTLSEALAAIARGFENKFSMGGLHLPFLNDPMRLAFLDKTYYYYLLIALAAILMIFQYLVQRSRWGILIIGARDSARASASLGVPVSRVLALVSVASAIPAAIVGSIFALTSLSVTVDNVFAFELLISIVIVTTIGGIGTLWGPFIGALTVTLVQEIIRRSFGTTIVGLTDVVYGGMLVAIIVLVPVGAVGIFRRLVSSRAKGGAR